MTIDNPTRGAIKKPRALELARAALPEANEGILLLILWHRTRYPFEKSEARLIEDLETAKRVNEGTVEG